MARTLNTPADVDQYLENRQVHRQMNFYSMKNHPQAPIPGVGGRVVEAKWGLVYERDEGGNPTEIVLHAAEEVSFAESAPGEWDKISTLRLG